jgi:hypothetical protein
MEFNPLNAKLNPIRHLLALLGAHHIFHVSRLRANDDLIIESILTVCSLPVARE